MNTSNGNKKRITSSKSKKKGWKKTDIGDVEEFLEEERIDERRGGKASEKPDDALFFVDAKVSEEQKLTRKQKRRLEKRQESSDDEDEQPFVSRKCKLTKMLKDEELANVACDKADLEDASKTDLWRQEVEVTVDKYLESTIKPKKKTPASFLKTDDRVLIEPVEVPVAGTSYNPDYDDHQTLLGTAHAIELAKCKKQSKLNKQVRMVSVKQMKENARQYLVEMSEGLNRATNRKEESTKEEPNPSCLADKLKVCPVSADDKKTNKERNRIINDKKLLRQRKLEKEEKKKLQDVYRIKTLTKEIKDTKLKSEKQIKKRQTIFEAKRRQPKRVGKYKFEVPNMEVQLSNELTGSMRNFKPEGSLLQDRFKSMQKRNLIEPRKLVPKHRKYKMKTYEKRSQKKKCIKEI